MAEQVYDDTRAARFWARVRKTESCWLWIGSALPSGYGKVSAREYAHRTSYEIHKGPIPTGLTIDHLCRNPRCVNPEHLEAVSLRENILRGNGAAAQNARKALCARGHALTQLADRSRICRMCARRSAKADNPNRNTRRHRRRLEGRCTWCANAAVPGKAYCASCRERRRESDRRYYRALLARLEA